MAHGEGHGQHRQAERQGDAGIADAHIGHAGGQHRRAAAAQHQPESPENSAPHRFDKACMMVVPWTENPKISRRAIPDFKALQSRRRRHAPGCCLKSPLELPSTRQRKLQISPIRNRFHVHHGCRLRAAKPVSETRAIRRRPDAAAGLSGQSLAGSPARDLPAGTIVDLPSVRYSNGQMEMRPADRATAALMGVVQPRAFEAFKAALLNDGDWRGLLHAFERSIPQNPGGGWGVPHRGRRVPQEHRLSAGPAGLRPTDPAGHAWIGLHSSTSEPSGHRT